MDYDKTIERTTDSNKMPSSENKGQHTQKSFAAKLKQHRDSPVLNIVCSSIIPLIIVLTTEWIAHISIKPDSGYYPYVPAFLLAYLFLVCLYVAISQLTGAHAIATALLGILCNLLALISHFKLTLRNEPFLPWDFTQIGDLIGVGGKVSFTVPLRVWVTAGIIVALIIITAFVRIPRSMKWNKDFLSRIITGGAAAICSVALLFAVFLSPKGSTLIGLKLDMWRQKGTLISYGVVTSFLTNFQMVRVEEPREYSVAKVEKIEKEIEANRLDKPLFAGSFAANGGKTETPDIIYIMAEAFWDPSEFPGIRFERELTPTMNALKERAAYGKNYSPSYGGGTCDVEFEVLTGYSMEFLPSGSKPFQSHITNNADALPWLLKERGYETMAIHGYGRRFWNRDVAYPRLGIDTFISEESSELKDASRRRGLISDDSMIDCIINEHSKRLEDGPLFIHTVTIQNHSTYSPKRYHASDLIKVVEAPPSIPEKAIGELEDYATSVNDMDVALGKLVEYLENCGKPTILVFWGDHKNSIAKDNIIYELTGMVNEHELINPVLQETPLLIWSNFDDSKVELGTYSSYNITPVMMDLYGIEKSAYFEFLAEQLPVSHGRTRGVTINTDNSYSIEMSEIQQSVSDKQAVLQYDAMFEDHLLWQNRLAKKE